MASSATVTSSGGSKAEPGGPIDRALRVDRQRAIKDTFLWGRPYAEQLYCDTLQIDQRLAIAVLTDRPSDGRFDVLEEVDLVWVDREEFCPRCGDERNVGWCDDCRGRLCRSRARQIACTHHLRVNLATGS